MCEGREGAREESAQLGDTKTASQPCVALAAATLAAHPPGLCAVLLPWAREPTRRTHPPQTPTNLHTHQPKHPPPCTPTWMCPETASSLTPDSIHV